MEGDHIGRKDSALAACFGEFTDRNTYVQIDQYFVHLEEF